MIKRFFIKYFNNLWEAAKKERKNQILHLLQQFDFERGAVLDCGCGDGEFTTLLKKVQKKADFFGIEIDESLAKKAKGRKIAVKLSDLNLKFPFKTGTFDVVVADQVIEHLWDLDNFVSEIRRVLKTKKYAIISTENLASWHNNFALMLGLQPFSGPAPSNKHFMGFHPLASEKRRYLKKSKKALAASSHTKVLTLCALIGLLEAYGFKVQEVKTAGYLPLPHIVSRFISNLDKRHSLFVTVLVKKKN